VSATGASLVDAASLIVTALGIVVGGVVLVRTERLLPALAALLEMLTGAGLLRLAAAPTLTRALTAGSVLLVRRRAAAGRPAAAPARPDRPSAEGRARPWRVPALRSRPEQHEKHPGHGVPWLSAAQLARQVEVQPDTTDYHEADCPWLVPLVDSGTAALREAATPTAAGARLAASR